MNTHLRALIPIVTVMAVISSTLAIADPHRGHDDYRRSHRYDYPRQYNNPRWREGHWYHEDHRGRIGWWWISANDWYFYSAPVYPYPAPYSRSTIVIEREPEPPQESIWYYCNSSRAYYPYTLVCPEGWQTVPAEPRDADER